MLKVACQAMSGKGGLEEACRVAAMRELGEVTLPVGDARGCGAFVTDLGPDPLAVEAEHVSESCQALETRAKNPPLLFEVAVPKDAKPGQQVKALGPGGHVVVQLSANAKPGGSARFAMKLKPRYLVEVPQKAGPGWTIRFRANGCQEVQVTVPPGLSPGDTFEVPPPALFVKVPETAQPGDFVKFIHAVNADGDTRSGLTECFRAMVPEGVGPKQYFTAIIPPPGQAPQQPAE